MATLKSLRKNFVENWYVISDVVNQRKVTSNFLHEAHQFVLSITNKSDKQILSRIDEISEKYSSKGGYNYINDPTYRDKIDQLFDFIYEAFARFCKNQIDKLKNQFPSVFLNEKRQDNRENEVGHELVSKKRGVTFSETANFRTVTIGGDDKSDKEEATIEDVQKKVDFDTKEKPQKKRL
ncbi:MAG: hypothetical protein RLZ35_261 [Pseudomonadota bacterium]